MKTSMAVLLTILVMLGLAGGGYYYLSKQSTTDKATLQTQIDDLTAKLATEKTASTAATAVDTSSWKTYTNSAYGFSLKYPSNWKLTERKIDANNPEQIAYIEYRTSSTDGYLNAGGAGVDIVYKKAQNPTALQESDYSKSLNAGETATKTKADTIINGVNVPTFTKIVTKANEGLPSNSMSYYFSKGTDTIKLILTVVTEGSSKTESIADTIASSFQFTK